MGAMRRCSKTGCQREALATLTYNYADSAMVIGPLSRRAEPHTYDLCGDHAAAMTAPKGWEVLRLELPERYEPVPGPDDLLAVADALRPPRTAVPPPPQASSPAPDAAPRPSLGGADGPARPGRGGLHVIRSADETD